MEHAALRVTVHNLDQEHALLVLDGVVAGESEDEHAHETVKLTRGAGSSM